jgi:hypothetical protein
MMISMAAMYAMQQLIDIVDDSLWDGTMTIEL